MIVLLLFSFSSFGNFFCLVPVSLWFFVCLFFIWLFFCFLNISLCSGTKRCSWLILHPLWNKPFLKEVLVPLLDLYGIWRYKTRHWEYLLLLGCHSFSALWADKTKESMSCSIYSHICIIFCNYPVNQGLCCPCILLLCNFPPLQGET